MKLKHLVLVSITVIFLSNNANARYLEQMRQYEYVNAQPPVAQNVHTYTASPSITSSPNLDIAIALVDSIIRVRTRSNVVPQRQYADGMNLYQYVASNPTNYTDSYGLRAIRCPNPAHCKPIPRPGFTPTANGCGAGPFVHIVPDSFLGVDFTPACNNHDICYTKCDKSKGYCDDELWHDMRVRCYLSLVPITPFPEDAEAALPQLELCFKVADLYFSAVKNLGEGPHTTGQKAGCCCSDDPSRCKCEGS